MTSYLKCTVPVWVMPSNKGLTSIHSSRPEFCQRWITNRSVVHCGVTFHRSTKNPFWCGFHLVSLLLALRTHTQSESIHRLSHCGHKGIRNLKMQSSEVMNRMRLCGWILLFTCMRHISNHLWWMVLLNEPLCGAEVEAERRRKRTWRLRLSAAGEFNYINRFGLCIYKFIHLHELAK